MQSPTYRGGLLLALILALSGLFPASRAEAARYAQGERVRVTGVVTDAKGTPLQNIQVTLVASRSFFNLRQLKPSDKDLRRVAATTGGKGEYTIEWPWDTYYNRFEVQVGLPLRAGRTERVEVLASQDVTQLLDKGTPAVPALVVANVGLIDRVRQFRSELTSEDLKKVYDDMGDPDQVKKVLYPDHEEVSWWYFESGAMYRFSGGKLAEVVHFTPVKPF